MTFPHRRKQRCLIQVNSVQEATKLEFLDVCILKKLSFTVETVNFSKSCTYAF